MNKPLSRTVCSLMLLSPLAVATPAFAQWAPVAPRAAAPAASSVPATPPSSVPAPAAAAPAPAAPMPAANPAEEMPPPSTPADEVPPPVLTAPPPAEPAPGDAALADQVSELSGRVDGINETLLETKGTADKLAKLKFSGYVQGRYEYHRDAKDGLDSSGKGTSTSRFLVRRGRLKAQYAGTNAEYLLQIDATGSGVVLKDAEATFIEPWSPLNLHFTVGQFKWTFGYEIQQSSSVREMPERSLVIRKLFPGERDRGLRVKGSYEWLHFAAALVNGTGTEAAVGVNDDSSYKDVVARVGGDWDVVVGGISGYWGHVLRPDTTTAMSPATLRFSKLRLGADVQGYIDVPGIGGLALKGELIYAKDSNLSYKGVSADSCLDVTALGWIVTAVQNVGDNLGVVARVDQFDPDYGKALDSSCPSTRILSSQGDPSAPKYSPYGTGERVTTFGGGLLAYGSGNIKASFIYEHPVEQNTAVKNGVFTAQLQALF